MKYLFATVLTFFSLMLILGGAASGQDKKDEKKPDEKKVDEKKPDEKPKYDIKTVMAKAQKSKMSTKVADGMGTADEKKELVELFVALSQNTPPKGDPKSWKDKTTSLVDAAKAVAKGDDPKAGENLKKVNNCMACHSEHKGK